MIVLNGKPETIKHVEKNIGGKFFDIGLGDNFLILTTKAKTKRHKQVGLQPITKLLQRKENH